MERRDAALEEVNASCFGITAGAVAQVSLSRAISRIDHWNPPSFLLLFPHDQPQQILILSYLPRNQLLVLFLRAQAFSSTSVDTLLVKGNPLTPKRRDVTVAFEALALQGHI